MCTFDYLVERKSDGKKFVIGNSNFKEPGLRATRLFEVLTAEEAAKYPHQVQYHFGITYGNMVTANVTDTELKYNSNEYKVVFQTNRELIS